MQDNYNQIKKKPVVLKEILEDFLNNYKKSKETPQTIILKNWEEIISKQAVNESRPITIKNKVLIVAVSNSALLHHLTFQKREICKKIEKILNSKTIKDIRFKISEINKIN